jgi:hypothetical protein
MKIRKMEKNCLTTNLGNILLSSQYSLAKTNPYAYESDLTCSYTFIGWLFQQFETR